MGIVQILQSFARDTQVHIVAVLIAADVVFGVFAAVKTHTFQLQRVVDTLHDDVLAKVLPWLAVFAFGKVSGTSVLGLDFGSAADGLFIGITAAMAASIVKSLADLGAQPVPTIVAGTSKP